MKSTQLNHNWSEVQSPRSLRSVPSLAGSMLGATLVLALAALSMNAQTPAADVKATLPKPVTETYETLYLTNLTTQNDLNDIQTAMRNMIPQAKIYGMPSQRSISLWGTPEDLALAQKVLSDLDRKKSIYRVTYTLTESDGGKRVGSQHFALIVISGEKTDLKQGNRVPIVTGKFDTETPTANTQVQYLDVGLQIQTTAESFQDGVRLRTKIEQSNVSDEKSTVAGQDPVIRQTTLEGTSTLMLGKPLIVGSLDVPGSTRHQDVEVVAELVK
jgi:type II secretory pathway component GspD/PulD (secretin)